MRLIYLASPYSHVDEAVRQNRYEQACYYAGYIMRSQYEAVYSPIAHSHPIELAMDRELSDPHKFWMRQCTVMLRKCDVLYVLMIPGWDTSKGVAEEVEIANRLLIPVNYYEIPKFHAVVKKQRKNSKNTA